MDVEIETYDGVRTITLNRPAQLNAMTAEMSDLIASELEQSIDCDDVRVLVLAGSGSAFISGADLSGANAHEHFDVTSPDRANRVARAIVALPRPRTAYECGLISHVVADDAFDAEVTGLTRRLAAGPPLAYAATKQAVNTATLTELEAVLARGRSAQSVLLRTADVAEGMRVFSEKRRPHFIGE